MDNNSTLSSIIAKSGWLPVDHGQGHFLVAKDSLHQLQQIFSLLRWHEKLMRQPELISRPLIPISKEGRLVKEPHLALLMELRESDHGFSQVFPGCKSHPAVMLIRRRIRFGLRPLYQQISNDGASKTEEPLNVETKACIEYIYRTSLRPQTQKRLDHKRRSLAQNLQSVATFASAVSKIQDLLVVPLELNFSKPSGDDPLLISCHISLDQAMQYHRKLCDVMSRRHDWPYLVACLWFMQAGSIETGVRFHWFLFVEAKSSATQEDIMHRFGKLWLKLTDNEGSYGSYFLHLHSQQGRTWEGCIKPIRKTAHDRKQAWLEAAKGLCVIQSFIEPPKGSKHKARHFGKSVLRH